MKRPKDVNVKNSDVTYWNKFKCFNVPYEVHSNENKIII